MSETRIEGTIRVLGLTDWWVGGLDEADRKAICEHYGPGQGETPGELRWTSQSRVSFLTTIATWLNKESVRFTAYKCLAKADEIWPDQASVIDLHFGLQHRCEVYYRWRDVDDFALDEAISSCRRSVAMQKDAAAALRKQGFVTWGNGIPGHHCFRQLAIIEEKRGNLDDAISLCKEARKEGWLDGWDKRIARLEKKRAKAIQARG